MDEQTFFRDGANSVMVAFDPIFTAKRCFTFEGEVLGNWQVRHFDSGHIEDPYRVDISCASAIRNDLSPSQRMAVVMAPDSFTFGEQIIFYKTCRYILASWVRGQALRTPHPTEIALLMETESQKDFPQSQQRYEVVCALMETALSALAVRAYLVTIGQRWQEFVIVVDQGE